MHAIGHALAIAGTMTWAITWALILGFTLSAMIQAVVRRSVIVRMLGDDRWRTLAISPGLGAALLFRVLLRERLLCGAREQAARGLGGSMEGHAAMDMSVQRDGSLARRLWSADGFTAVSHVFVMEWAAILRDLVIGLLAAGAIAAWVPEAFWQSFFASGHPLAAALWGR